MGRDRGSLKASEMTTREWMAMVAMQGICADPLRPRPLTRDELAQEATMLADALLSALAETAPATPRPSQESETLDAEAWEIVGKLVRARSECFTDTCKRTPCISCHARALLARKEGRS